MFILCDFLPDFILITSFSSLKHQRMFFLHSLHSFLHRSLAPLFTSTFSFTMLQFLLPDILLSPPPPFFLPSYVLNTYFHSVLEIWIQGPSSCSDILNLLQSPGICHCSFILHQPVPAYGWSIGFLSQLQRKEQQWLLLLAAILLFLSHVSSHVAIAISSGQTMKTSPDWQFYIFQHAVITSTLGVEFCVRYQRYQRHIRIM